MKYCTHKVPAGHEARVVSSHVGTGRHFFQLFGPCVGSIVGSHVMKRFDHSKDILNNEKHVSWWIFIHFLLQKSCKWLGKENKQ
jgi:hypothetical protein